MDQPKENPVPEQEQNKSPDPLDHLVPAQGKAAARPSEVERLRSLQGDPEPIQDTKTVPPPTPE
ncbi:MAG: hypothetical protein JO112_14510 [Planctomycetes bacterium]|nr:hypothetical protein [Planctomycetota bacterium]